MAAVAMVYHHTQAGSVILAVCLVIAALMTAIAWRTGEMSITPSSFT
ncbi:MAG TPA: hypothetical protein VFK01_17845 [Bradyrhizobium sp.]|jgi:hypothetical protein|nr:hypothetical protein [Bradyrhizobium sp.]